MKQKSGSQIYLTDAMGENLVLLEVGVGFDTPDDHPFPRLKSWRGNHSNIQMIRLNLDDVAMPRRPADTRRNRNRRRSGMCDPTVIKCIKCRSGKFGLSGFSAKISPSGRARMMSNAEASQEDSAVERLIIPRSWNLLYRYNPGTIMTIEGTVIEILGYPATPFRVEARSPARNAPINAAAAGGILTRSD